MRISDMAPYRDDAEAIVCLRKQIDAMTIEHKIVKATPNYVCVQCNQFWDGACAAYQMPHSERERERREQGGFGMECDTEDIKALRFRRFNLQYRTPPGKYVYTLTEAKHD